VITRRQLLRSSVAGAALLTGVGLLVPLVERRGGPADAPSDLKVLSPTEWAVVEAVAARILASDGGEGPDAQAAEAGRFADRYLAGLDAGLRQDVRALLLLIEYGAGPLALRPRRFTRLSAASQDAILRDWEQSALALRRQGFQALKTLCLFAYWRLDGAWPEIGYTGPLVARRGAPADEAGR
jgi:hypothetical protein